MTSHTSSSDGPPAKEPTAEAEAVARYERDRAAVAAEAVASLRDDLDAAHRLNAEALRRLDVRVGDLEAAHRELDDRQRYVESLEAQIEAFKHSRLVRYTKGPRKLYASLRRKPTPAGPEAT